MDLKCFFTEIPEITVDGVRELMMGRRASSWTLIDVRQPEEYEAGHLPGAELIELGRLRDAIDRIPRDDVVVVYCRSGRRSASATAMLRHAGVAGAVNLAGGILAWRGVAVGGWPMAPLEPVLAPEVTAAQLEVALWLEQGTRRFYAAQLERSDFDDDARALLADLAASEEAHRALLAGLAARAVSGPGHDGAEEGPQQMEGGLPVTQVLAWAARAEPAEVVEVAAGSEALAWDRYEILSRRTDDDELAAGLERLARDEKEHLDRLIGLHGRLRRG